MHAAAHYSEEEHLPQTQIAKVIGVSQGTVSRRLSTFYAAAPVLMDASASNQQTAAENNRGPPSHLQLMEFERRVRSFVQKKPTSNPRSKAAWPKKRTGKRRSTTISEVLRSCEDLQEVFQSGNLPEGVKKEQIKDVFQASFAGVEALTSLIKSVASAQNHDPQIKSAVQEVMRPAIKNGLLQYLPELSHLASEMSKKVAYVNRKRSNVS